MRYVAVGESLEALPRQPVPLAPPKQGVPPCAADLTAETFQSLEIAGDHMVVKVALHHAVQPPADFGNGLVPPPHQSGPNDRQRRPHAFLHREANDLEPTLTARSAAVREPEKVERLRMTLAPISTVVRSEAAKLD